MMYSQTIDWKSYFHTKMPQVRNYVNDNIYYGCENIKNINMSPRQYKIKKWLTLLNSISKEQRSTVVISRPVEEYVPEYIKSGFLVFHNISRAIEQKYIQTGRCRSVSQIYEEYVLIDPLNERISEGDSGADIDYTYDQAKIGIPVEKIGCEVWGIYGPNSICIKQKMGNFYFFSNHKAHGYFLPKGIKFLNDLDVWSVLDNYIMMRKMNINANIIDLTPIQYILMSNLLRNAMIFTDILEYNEEGLITLPSLGELLKAICINRPDLQMREMKSSLFGTWMLLRKAPEVEELRQFKYKFKFRGTKRLLFNDVVELNMKPLVSDYISKKDEQFIETHGLGSVLIYPYTQNSAEYVGNTQLIKSGYVSGNESGIRIFSSTDKMEEEDLTGTPMDRRSMQERSSMVQKGETRLVKESKKMPRNMPYKVTDESNSRIDDDFRDGNANIKNRNNYKIQEHVQIRKQREDVIKKESKVLVKNNLNKINNTTNIKIVEEGDSKFNRSWRRKDMEEG